MRRIVDTLIALMLLGILAAVLLHYRQADRQLAEHQAVHEALARMHEQMTYHGAVRDVELTAAGFPRRLQPAWFGEELPVNALVSGDRPWLDVAPSEDQSDQPPDPVIRAPAQAAFWYNPNRGIIRARVAPQVNKQETLALYNRINATALPALPSEPDPARTPRAQSSTPVANMPDGAAVSPAVAAQAAPADLALAEQEAKPGDAPAYTTLLARPPSRDER